MRQPHTDLMEIEIIRGRECRKVSPTRTHGLTQAALIRLIYRCANGRGQVVPEWRLSLGARDTYVPDVAFATREQLLSLEPAQREEPPIAPVLVVEVWSPSNRRSELNDKIATYLQTGARLVLDVDPYERTIVAHDARGVRRFGAGERFEHEALPWLIFEVDEAFAELDEL